MKLIKQNDSAGGLIFKQNNNGKAMKQNYNFGRGFNKSLTNNCYIECPFVPQITEPFTILSWNDLNPPTSDISLQSNCFLLRDLDNGAKLSMGVRAYSGTTILSRANVWNSGSGHSVIGSAPWSSGQKGMLGVRTDGVQFQAIRSNSYGTLQLNSSLNQSASTNLYAALSNYSGIKYESRLVLDFKVYSRKITDEEVSYLYNNNLGNEPLSVFGLKAWYKMNNAEILEYKGNSAVCVRDYSGNGNHGFIHGLPAGTLQEQLTWANSNIFFTSL